MSGFLPDLASWALRGGAASNDSNDSAGGGASNSGGGGEEPPPLTPEELRAQRLARMEELQRRATAQQQQQEQQDQQQEKETNEKKTTEPMEIDTTSGADGGATTSSDDAMETSPTNATATDAAPPVKASSPASGETAPTKSSATATTADSQKKQKRSNSNLPSGGGGGAAGGTSSSSDACRKLQRKKELLLKKVLNIVLVGSSLAVVADTGMVVAVDIDSTEISVQSIAEILATRLTLSASSSPAVMAKPLMAYLAYSHTKAGEEWQTLHQLDKKKSYDTAAAATTGEETSNPNSQLKELCEEIQRQVVSYAVSCLMEPDLFEAGKDGIQQLANCLLGLSSTGLDSITVGLSGATSSFYYCLVEEILQQDADFLNKLVQNCVNYYMAKLTNCDSSLDSFEGTDGRMIVTALTGLCLHKKAAEALTRVPQFLMPPDHSPQANELIRPQLPSQGGGSALLQMFAGEHRPYKRRSGPALEKQTILGAALRLGAPPKSNPAFSPTSILNQSLDSVERATLQQRTQLQIHQEACCQFVLQMVKAGPDARAKVIQWFLDALLVNFGASALRPDPTKVSSTNTLLNLSVVLLRLCEPFVDDEKKMKLIDPGFVSAPDAHQGVYALTGDHAVQRLGGGQSDDDQGEDAVMTTPYEPKNTFIPLCFFLCARSLHFGISPALSHHENILRHISHHHYELSSSGRDIRSDPQFGLLLSRQRSAEVALFQPSMVQSVIRFLNFEARVLNEAFSDDILKTMPEDFVSDVCGILMSIAKIKPKLLENTDLKYVFKLVVKLLSSKYASMVRNYNLRAALGDILYELFLPPTSGDRRDIPNSVWIDPMAGGQPYLLSDVSSQETLAPSLLLLYGEVEHTGYYDKMSHRAKIASLIKFLWESSEHRTAFRHITQDKVAFIKFANGIMNETNTLIATVMQKLPEIREAQERMKDAVAWGQLSQDQQTQISERLDESEREVKHALPLCNKTLQMFGYLNTDPDIRNLFLLEELCPRLVTMLLHVLTKLVGSKGLDLKVDNPEQYDFRPKEMLRDLCAIFALFSGASDIFPEECAKSGCDPNLLRSAVKTCRRLNLLTGESMTAFEQLPDLVDSARKLVSADEALLADAPDDFLDEILTTFMKDPVILPSGHYVDRSTITQHLLNDPSDPFNREPLTLNDLQPATDLKRRMDQWLQEKQQAAAAKSSSI